MQSGLYTYLLRVIRFSVTVQDIDRTNALLKKNIILKKNDELTSDELAKILGVDAVIKCSYVMKQVVKLVLL
jgi:hypothetical protein